MIQSALNYFALGPKSSLFKANICPYDIFLKIGENHFVRVFNEGSEFEASRIDSYLQKGITQFYLQRKDADQYLKLLIDKLNQTQAEDLAASLPVATEALENSLINIFDSAAVNSYDITRVTKLSDFLASAIESEKTVLNTLEVAFQNSPYGVKHSMDVALICLGIYQNLPVEAQNQFTISEIVQAGLLHDIAIPGLLPEPYDYATSRMILVKGWLLAHSVMAAHALDQVPTISKKVQLAIEQHHEYIDGSGGPYAIENDQISVLGKILSLAEDFQVRLEGHQGAMFDRRKKAFQEISNQEKRFDTQSVEALKKFIL